MKILFFLLFFFLVQTEARVIVDDYGRSVVIPDKVTKIYAASPPISMSVLAFNPALLSALNTPFTPEQKPYVGIAYDKPIAGGFFGQGQTPNFELLAASKPDVILMWGGMNGYKKVLKKLKMLNIPVLLVRNSTIKDLITQFELYGKLTGERTRAKELIAYTQETLTLIDSLQSTLAKKKRVRYYFAEGVDGMNSECSGSFHLEPFIYSGATNALNCKMSSNYGMERISFENILLSNPDVIVAMQKSFYDGIYKNPKFKSLRAVKNKKVYLVPSLPFNYITRPPSFMRLMGIRWLIHSFYPELLPLSLSKELDRFEKIFFQSIVISK